MAALYAFYFVLRLVRPGGMGGGDVKLAGVIGIYLGWVGWGALAVGAFAAFVFGGVFGIALMLRRRAGRKTAIPFGPWMILGAWTGVFAGEAVGRWYVNLVHWGLRERTSRMAKTIVGLEVTEESVRAAEVSLGRKPQLVAYGEVPLPPEAARDSEVLDSGAVAVALRQLWTGARFKSKDVVLGVASRRILVREYTTQAMRPDLLRDALPYQVQDLLPVPASQAVLDFYPLSAAGRSGLGSARRRGVREHRADHRDPVAGEAARAGRRPRRVRARARHGTARGARRDRRDREHRRPHHAGRRRARRHPAVRPTAADRRATTAAARATRRSTSSPTSALEYASAATTRTRGAMRAAAPPGVVGPRRAAAQHARLLREPPERDTALAGLRHRRRRRGRRHAARADGGDRHARCAS